MDQRFKFRNLLKQFVTTTITSELIASSMGIQHNLVVEDGLVGLGSGCPRDDCAESTMEESKRQILNNKSGIQFSLNT